MAQDYPSFREHTRAPIHARVEIRFDERPDTVLAFAANVSEGGMFVEIADPRPVGTLLQFRLELSAEEQITGFGEVAWIRVRAEGPRKPPGCGIQFRFLDPGGRERLQVFIKKTIAAMGSGTRP